ncbi:MAG: hypothetical protein IKL36_02300 [Clostridia bacterium]|nr:hypothetical protein [Clostridia bacterium]
MDKLKYSLADSPAITTAKFDIVNYCEGSCEYNMPDYYPPVRKIVNCTADALPDTKFISGNTLEYGGTVAFTVMYIGEDGALVSLPYATEYNASQSLPSEVRGTAEIAIDAKAEDIQCRVLAPRKISLKSKIKTRISSEEKIPYRMQMLNCEEENVSSSERAAIQSLSHKIPVVSGARVVSTGKVTGEIREKQGSKPVSCGGVVNITEVKCRRDTVIVKGEACARCIVFTPDGYYAPARARIPFEEVIVSDGANEGDLCRAWGRVASVSVSEGDGGVLNTEIEYDLDAQWCRKGEISVVEDAYAAGCNSETERTDINSHSLLCCTYSALSVAGSGKRTTKPEPNEYIVDMCCEATVEKVEQKDEYLIFSGSCRIKAFIVSNGEVICEEILLPLKYETAAQSPLADGKIIVYADIVCTDVNGRLEGDTVYANAELCLSLYVKRECKIHPLSKIKLEALSDEGACNPQIKILYGSGDNVLWDVSKKYRVAVGKLEEVNGLSRTDSVNGKTIIIPIGID